MTNVGEMPGLPSREEIEAAFGLLYRYAQPGSRTRICVFGDRADRQARDGFWMQTVPTFLLPATTYQLAAQRRGCVASPTTTCDLSGRPLEALAISLDLDTHVGVSLARLREVLGPPTLTLESGTSDRDPISGKAETRLLVHWRLARPALPPEHAAVEQCAYMASICAGLGGGCTAPVESFTRWPGTWNYRSQPPRMARIAEANPDREVHLSAAFARLQSLDVPPLHPHMQRLLACPKPWFAGKPHLQQLARQTR